MAKFTRAKPEVESEQGRSPVYGDRGQGGGAFS